MSEPKSVAYCMDCMEAMRKMPDKCFDLAVVDPPYGIGVSGGKMGGDVLAINKDYKHFSGDDIEPPDREYFSELQRVSKNQVIFGANHFIDNLPEPRNASCWLVWDKENGDNNFADCELAWTSEGGAVRQFRFKWQGMLQGDMKNKELRIHPTQKPVRLYEWIFGRYANKGDKILDTHLGSGSSRIAAWNAGLDFVGFEIDPDYFEKQEQRFREYSAQINLFHGLDEP